MKILDEVLKDVEGKEEIIGKIKEEVALNYVPKTDFNRKNEELKEVGEQLAERDTQLEELKAKAKDNEELTSQIEALQEQNTAAKAEHEAQIAAINKNIAIEKAIAASELNFVDTELVKTLVNIEDIKVNDDGVIGLSEQLEKIAGERPFLTKTEDPEDKPLPKIISGKGGKGDSKLTAQDIFNMGPVERAKFKNENEELYNKIVK